MRGLIQLHKPLPLDSRPANKAPSSLKTFCIIKSSPQWALFSRIVWMYMHWMRKLEKNASNIRFHVSSGSIWGKGISTLFSRYLDRDSDIFITHIYIDTHMVMKKPESIWVLGWHALPTSCQKQFAAKFKSLLHLLGKSAKAAKLNQCPVTRLASGHAAKQVTSPPPALLHKHDPRALNSPGHGVLRELASVYLHSEIMYKRMWTLAGGTKNDLHEIAELNVSGITAYTSECLRVEIV